MDEDEADLDSTHLDVKFALNLDIGVENAKTDSRKTFMLINPTLLSLSNTSNTANLKLTT